MDFTIEKYKELVSAFKANGYRFISFAEYLKGAIDNQKIVILRHDVDRRPINSLLIARIESDLGAQGSYYFRAVSESWDELIIKEIQHLGHEVGYHYESLTTCRGNIDDAYQDFCMNLNKLRKLVDVQTICMHGSPRSPYDSKDIWGGQFSYRDLNIIGEPYFDVDFSKVFYLTDTGRRWDGYRVSVRDKVEKWQDLWIKQGLSFHSTGQIIQALITNRIPPQVMITVHPQRWNYFGVVWMKEYAFQNIKNVVKRFVVKRKHK